MRRVAFVLSFVSLLPVASIAGGAQSSLSSSSNADKEYYITNHGRRFTPSTPLVPEEEEGGGNDQGDPAPSPYFQAEPHDPDSGDAWRGIDLQEGNWKDVSLTPPWYQCFLDCLCLSSDLDE